MCVNIVAVNGLIQVLKSSGGLCTFYLVTNHFLLLILWLWMNYLIHVLKSSGEWVYFNHMLFSYLGRIGFIK